MTRLEKPISRETRKTYGSRAVIFTLAPAGPAIINLPCPYCATGGTLFVSIDKEELLSAECTADGCVDFRDLQARNLPPLPTSWASRSAPPEAD